MSCRWLNLTLLLKIPDQLLHETRNQLIASFSELLCTTKVSDIEFDADGNAYAIIGLASNPANRDSLQVLDFAS
ncbi:hypothetical protein H6F95_29000 [Cyanobacteria bacterium FACHB-471]|nr:hypothetical protein [Cyanobacteria bacterium FACHB-471]